MFMHTIRIVPNLLHQIGGLCVDSKGIIYVTDCTLHQIFKVERIQGASHDTTEKNLDIFDSIRSSFNDTDFINVNIFHSVQYITYSCTLIAGSKSGYQNGVGKEAQFKRPYGIATDESGTLFIADRENHRIRQVIKKEDGSVIVETLAGNGIEGRKDGNFDNCQFSWPFQMSLKHSQLYVSEIGTHTIRKMDLNNRTVTTIAGCGKMGFMDGIHTKSMLSYPHDIAVDNNGVVYVSDFSNNCIRKVDNGHVTALVGSKGYHDGNFEQAEFWCPDGLALDMDGNLIVGDKENRRIRKIDLRKIIVTTLAGNGLDKLYDGSPLLASFRTKSSPFKVTVAPDDSILIVDNDYDTAVIRRLCVAGMPWCIERLLWIANTKCSPEETPMAKLPAEMIQHIIVQYKRIKFVENHTNATQSLKRKREDK